MRACAGPALAPMYHDVSSSAMAQGVANMASVNTLSWMQRLFGLLDFMVIS
jgi:hypothetical protein